MYGTLFTVTKLHDWHTVLGSTAELFLVHLREKQYAPDNLRGSKFQPKKTAYESHSDCKAGVGALSIVN